jgi:multicomponent Na+:H+ antiporter subunit E
MKGTLRRNGVRVVWLTLVWVLLWGTFSWANLLGGLAVAVLVLLVFPLPAVTSAGRLRPVALLLVVLDVGRDLVVSSLQVAWQSVRPGPPIRSSIVAARLSADAEGAELLVAMLVECLCLVPGSVVVEASADEGIIYAHVLGADDQAAIDRFQAQVARLEAELVAAGVHRVRVRPDPTGDAAAGTDPRDDPDDPVENEPGDDHEADPVTGSSVSGGER